MKKLLGILILLVITYATYQFFKPSLDTIFQPPPVSNAQVSTVTIGDHTYKVDIADTDSTRAQGLSGRKALGEFEGMLFVYEKKDLYAFWMKDMLFPIDIIWIDGDTIVDMHEDVPVPVTATYLPRYQPQAPVDKVLEINAGEVKKWGFKVGDKITINLFHQKRN